MHKHFGAFSGFSDGKKSGQGKAELNTKIMTQQLADYTAWKKNSSLPIFSIFGAVVHQQHDLD